jgi:hypothetical protein
VHAGASPQLPTPLLDLSCMTGGTARAAAKRGAAGSAAGPAPKRGRAGPKGGLSHAKLTFKSPAEFFAENKNIAGFDKYVGPPAGRRMVAPPA